MNRIHEYHPDNFKAIVNVDRPNTKKVFKDFFIEPLTVLLDERTIMPSLPHRKTLNDFVFVIKGQLDKMVCSTIYNIRPGSFMLLPPYKIRALLSNSKDLQGYYCHFSNEFISENSGLKKIQEIFNLAEMTNVYTFLLDKHSWKRVSLLLKVMLQLYSIDNSENLLKVYLNTVLGELAHYLKSLPTPIFSQKETLTQRFRKLITDNIQHTHAIQTYAQLLHVSPNHLNKSVKSVTGKTASNLINETLLMEAKALLSLPEYNITEIAFLLGFEDKSYFSRFFKKHTTQCPREYRKRLIYPNF